MSTSSAPSARIRLSLFGVAAIALVLGSAVACSSSSKSTAGGTTTGGATVSSSDMSSMAGSSVAAPSTPDMVEVKNFSFTPMTLTVAVGTKVTWKFDDSAQHTVSAMDKSFVSPAMNNGQTYSYIFTKAGTFQYICSIHQYMKGTVVVQ